MNLHRLIFFIFNWTWKSEKYHGLVISLLFERCYILILTFTNCIERWRFNKTANIPIILNKYMKLNITTCLFKNSEIITFYFLLCTNFIAHILFLSSKRIIIIIWNLKEKENKFECVLWKHTFSTFLFKIEMLDLSDVFVYKIKREHFRY